MDGLAKEARVSFMQHINDTVIIDIAAAFADLTAAGRADGYFFCYRLAAPGTKFHGNLFSREWLMVCFDLLPLGHYEAINDYLQIHFIIYRCNCRNPKTLLGSSVEAQGQSCLLPLRNWGSRQESKSGNPIKGT
jgi:hypothetical protein